MNKNNNEGNAKIERTTDGLKIIIPTKKVVGIILFFLGGIPTVLPLLILGWLLKMMETPGVYMADDAFLWIILPCLPSIIGLGILFGKEVICVDNKKLNIEKNFLGIKIGRNYDIDKIKNIRIVEKESSTFSEIGKLLGLRGMIHFEYDRKVIKFGINIDAAEAGHLLKNITDFIDENKEEAPSAVCDREEKSNFESKPTNNYIRTFEPKQTNNYVRKKTDKGRATIEHSKNDFKITIPVEIDWIWVAMFLVVLNFMAKVTFDAIVNMLNGRVLWFCILQLLVGLGPFFIVLALGIWMFYGKEIIYSVKDYLIIEQQILWIKINRREYDIKYINNIRVVENLIFLHGGYVNLRGMVHFDYGMQTVDCGKNLNSKEAKDIVENIFNPWKNGKEIL